MDDYNAITYEEFRRRLEHFGLIAVGSCLDGTEVFTRPVMGLGSPFRPVHTDGTVYSETIAMFVRVFGIPAQQWKDMDEN